VGKKKDKKKRKAKKRTAREQTTQELARRLFDPRVRTLVKLQIAETARKSEDD